MRRSTDSIRRTSWIYGVVLNFFLSAVSPARAAQADPGDRVRGNLIQFSSNGGWCWYQDERAVVDPAAGRLVIGAVENGAGVGGPERQGDIVALHHDLETGATERFLLRDALTSFGGGDDHNAPAFLVRPDGRILTCYAGHNNDFTTYYRITDGAAWGPEQTFNWNAQIPGGSNFQTTYSNLFHLSAEAQTFNIARCDERSPNLMVSGDLGHAWTYGGLLTRPDMTIGYVNGYFKYWSNGIDRIDFICTEHHPRDFNTSIYHGYIQNGRTFRSGGALMDADISDQSAPNPDEYTPVFLANTVVNAMVMTRCWNHDLMRYADGTIAALIKARINDASPPSDNPDHAFLYCRYDGAAWTASYLCRAGKKLYGSEQDYTGLGALDPDDPGTIYVSTPLDPRDDADLGVHEIFKGVTSDNGVTWAWTPVTEHSTRDNLRPIVPKWDAENTALLWWRGTYASAQRFDAAVVGLFARNSESSRWMTYVDADGSNTAAADGSPLNPTGPDSDRGPGDDRWHERTGYGNEGSVLASAEIDGEDAPMLKTIVNMPDAGIYDVWVHFWANPGYDWRIAAGLSEENMQVFRHMACQQVEDGTHESRLVREGGGNTFLYQAYLGRVHISGGETVSVCIDDYAIETGTEDHLIGDVARTWYDGISVASVDIGNQVPSSDPTAFPESCHLCRNYPNPFNPVTAIGYVLPEPALVRLDIFNSAGQHVSTLLNQKMSAGSHRIFWNAEGMPSGVYVCRLSAGGYVRVRKMLLLK